jgi:hypothetical protein
MKSFQQWKNEKQYLELQFNPNATAMPPATNPNFRGVQPVVNPATTANNTTANNAAANPAAEDPAAAGSEVNPAIQSKVKRMQDVIGSLAPKLQIQALGALESGVRNNLVQNNRGNLNKVWARNDIRDSRTVLKAGNNKN